MALRDDWPSYDSRKERCIHGGDGQRRIANARAEHGCDRNREEKHREAQEDIHDAADDQIRDSSEKASHQAER